MFARLLRRARREEDGIAYALYGVIVAQARQPALYLRYGVPDTLDGRFEMVVLHQVLLFHRLGREGETGQDLTQRVFDLFVADMDRSLREMGAGDMSVPRKMRKIAESFYGRLAAYGEGLQQGDPDDLATALARNLFTGPEAPSAVPLALYALAAVTALETQPIAAIARGTLAFPAPEGLTGEAS